MSIKDYFASLFNGIVSLLKGMQVTGRELVTPKSLTSIPKTATLWTSLSASARLSRSSTTPMATTSVSHAVCAR